MQGTDLGTERLDARAAAPPAPLLERVEPTGMNEVAILKQLTFCTGKWPQNLFEGT